MGNWWHIARLELTLAFKDRESVIWSLIAPIAMAWIFGTVFADKPPGPTVVAIDAGNNPAYVGTVFAGLLERGGLVLTDSEDATRVVLPDSLVPHLIDGGPVQVDIRTKNATSSRAQTIAARSREALYTMSFRVSADWLTEPPGDETVRSIIENEGPIYLESSLLGQRPRMVSGKVHQLPAMLVMFLMFQLMTFFMVSWVDDIKKGKIKRIVMSPTTTRDLFVAQLVARLVWGLLQVMVILGVGSLVLGVQLDVPWIYFSLILVAYMVAAISLGLLAGTFFDTTEKANPAGVMAGLLMAALGGCWWPLEVVSEQMRAVAMVLPTGVTMDALGEFIAVGPGAAFPFLNFVILMAMSAVMMPIAIRRMRRQIMN